MNLLHRKSLRQADISLPYARELSHAANSFGAPTKREARHNPGGFDRPFVGRDPDYYSRAASQVFRSAVSTDPELSELYSIAGSLSNAVSDSITSPYFFEGPRVSEASVLATVTRTIQTILREKELKLRLTGTRLERAEAISAFALRVIEGTAGHELFEEYSGLYPGLGAEAPANSADYWLTLQEQLATPVSS